MIDIIMMTIWTIIYCLLGAGLLAAWLLLMKLIFELHKQKGESSGNNKR